MRFDNPLAIALLIVGFIFFILGLAGGSAVRENGMAMFYLTGGVAAIIAGIMLWTARSRR